MNLMNEGPATPAAAEDAARFVRDSLPAGGLFATFHMLVQHVFLSLSIIAFAFAPQAMTRKLGAAASVHAGHNEGNAAGLPTGSL